MTVAMVDFIGFVGGSQITAHIRKAHPPTMLGMYWGKAETNMTNKMWAIECCKAWR